LQADEFFTLYCWFSGKFFMSSKTLKTEENTQKGSFHDSLSTASKPKQPKEA
jgi:hypothetical protein